VFGSGSWLGCAWGEVEAVAFISNCQQGCDLWYLLLQPVLTVLEGLDEALLALSEPALGLPVFLLGALDRAALQGGVHVPHPIVSHVLGPLLIPIHVVAHPARRALSKSDLKKGRALTLSQRPITSGHPRALGCFWTPPPSLISIA
jgi:hypothetical protein